MITIIALNKAHHACKMIELDGVEAFRTCSEKYGQEIAIVLLVSFLRHALNPKGEWPQDELVNEVEAELTKAGLFNAVTLQPNEFATLECQDCHSVIIVQANKTPIQSVNLPESCVCGGFYLAK